MSTPHWPTGVELVPHSNEASRASQVDISGKMIAGIRILNRFGLQPFSAAEHRRQFPNISATNGVLRRLCSGGCARLPRRKEVLVQKAKESRGRIAWKQFHKRRQSATSLELRALA